MDTIGGDMEENSGGLLNYLKEVYLFGYCRRLLDHNICNIWIHSLLTLWETLQFITYFTFVYNASHSDSKISLGDLETGITLIKNVSSPAGPTIFVIVIAVLCLLTAGIFFQAKLAHSEHKCLGKLASLFMKCANILLILISACFAPLCGCFLLLPFECDLAISAGLVSDSCWDFRHILYMVCGGVFFVVFIFFLIVYSLFLQDDFFHSKHMYAGTQVSYKLIGVLFKLLIAFHLTFGVQSQSFSTAVLGAILFCLLVRIYVLLMSPMMWDGRFTYLFLLADCVAGAFGLACFVGILTENVLSDKEIGVVAVFALCLAFAVGFLKRRLNDSYATLCLGDITTPNKSLHYLNSLLRLYLTMSWNEESKNKLLGALLNHQEMCEDDECKCEEAILHKSAKHSKQKLENSIDTPIHDDNKQQESEESALHHLKGPQLDPYIFILQELILGAKRKYPRNISLTLLESYFTNGILQNTYKAVYELVVAKNLQPDIIDSFTIYRYQCLVEEEILLNSSRAANALGETGITVVSAIRMEQMYNTFRKDLSEMGKNILLFLQTIGNSRNFNAERLETLAGEIGIKTNEIMKYFNEFSKEYPNHYQAMLEYGEFLDLALNCELEATQIRNKAESVKGIIRGKGITFNETNLLDLSKNENVAVFIISGNAGKVGTILNANDAVFANFGYEPKDVIEQNLNMFLPAYFQESHTELLHRLLESGGKEGESYFGTRFAGVCKDSRGYLHCYNLFFQLYPSLEKGLLFAFFAKKIDKFSHILQTKSDITEQDVGIITCDQQGYFLSISEHLTKYFGVPLSLILGQGKKSSADKARPTIYDLMPEFDFNDQDIINGRKAIDVSAKGLEKLIEVEAFTSEQLNLMYEKFDYVSTSYVYCKPRMYPNLTVYQIMFVKSDEDQWVHHGLQPEKVKAADLEDAFKYDVMSVTTSSSNDSVRKYMPLIKDIKDGGKSTDSYKIKLLQRVATLLCLILLGLNTTVMVLTLNNISTSVKRVITIENAWSRAVTLSNIHLYLKSLVNIAKGVESPSIHSDDKDNSRFPKLKESFINSIENLRILQNSLGKKEISFSDELDKFTEQNAMKIWKIDSMGVVYSEIKSSTISFAELIGYSIEFSSLSFADFNRTIRTPNYTSFIGTPVTIQEQAFYYVLYNTLGEYRTFSVSFSEALQHAAITESGKQMTTIVIFCTISLLFILCSGLLLSFIINKVKYTKLLVLAFYTQIPDSVTKYMTERTQEFLLHINKSKFEKPTQGASKTSVRMECLEDEVEEKKVHSSQSLSQGKLHKEEPEIIKVIDISPKVESYKEHKPLKERLEAEFDTEDANGNGKDASDIANMSKLGDVVSTNFGSTVKTHRLAIVCLLVLFEILFGGYTVSSIIFYQESASASKNSFNFLATYLGTHASFTYHMAIYGKLLTSHLLPSSLDQKNLLLYSIDKMHTLKGQYMKLKQVRNMALIKEVVKAQNYIDSPQGLCELYEQHGYSKDICKKDFNGLLRLGFTNIMNRILDEIWLQYHNFLVLGENLNFVEGHKRLTDMLQCKEEYLNVATNYLRDKITSEFNSYFDYLKLLVVIVYVAWLIMMLVVYLCSMRYFVRSLKKDVVQSNGILNMLPTDYLLLIAKNDVGRNFLKAIFL